MNLLFFCSSAGQRRDSLDFKGRQQMPPLNQFYGSMGNVSASPAGPMGLVQPGQSMTPPPSLSGSSSNLSVGEFDGGIFTSLLLLNMVDLIS